MFISVRAKGGKMGWKGYVTPELLRGAYTVLVNM